MANKYSLIIIILVFLLAGGFVYRTYFAANGVLSSQEAAEKVIAYINENMLRGEVKASLVNVSEEDGIYKLRLKIGEVEYDSYVTKNGKFLFPEGINLEQAPAVAGEEVEQEEIPKNDQPEVMLFVMSFCPYGNQAEELMKPVVDLLGDKVEVELRYVVYENYASGYPDYCLDEENKYCSMHGIAELNQNIRERCVYQNQKDKFWDFVTRVNEDCTAETVEECWEEVGKAVAVAVEAVKKCQKEKGLELAKQDKELNEKYEVSGSPTLVINGVTYTGARTSEGYKQAICNAFNSPPEACGQTLGSETSSPAGGACQ